MRRFVLIAAVALVAGNALGDLTVINDAEDCSGHRVRYDDRRAFVEKEVIDAAHLRSLELSVTNAPVTVIGGAASYSITVCKAAQFAEDLDDIRVALDGNELRATGPEDRRWHVMYSIRVPRGADINLSAKNGPLSVRDVEGTVVVRSHNGPLSLKNLRGSVEAETRNGPISVAGSSGTMRVTAQNGPLSVDLDGTGWNGSLEASTKNGPLSVTVPRGYNSGVVVEAHGRGPIACDADGCPRGLRMSDHRYDRGDEPRRIELGSGPVNVRLSTVNGPLTVRDE